MFTGEGEGEGVVFAFFDTKTAACTLSFSRSAAVAFNESVVFDPFAAAFDGTNGEMFAVLGTKG